MLICLANAPSIPTKWASAQLSHLPTKCLHLLSNYNVQITDLKQSLRFITMIYFVRAWRSSKRLGPAFSFAFVNKINYAQR